MADNIINKKEFAVRELAAQLITFYPFRAQVVRSIKDLTLQPGSNEITIYGITHTADESSIKVEGTGAGIVTDMTIDLVDNPEHFEDVYSSDSESTALSQCWMPSEPDEESQALQDVNSQLRRLDWSVKEAAEQRNSAQGRLNMLENYAQSLTRSPPNNIEACVEAYQLLRTKAFESYKSGELKIEDHEEEIKKLNVKRFKLLREEKESKREAEESKAKAKKAEERERRRIRSEMDRLRRERTSFWPKKVYKVVICLDTKTDMTPVSSRRTSIDSLQKPTESLHHSGNGKSDSRSTDVSTIDLSLSYITSSASWSPRYELAINTTSKSGSIIYRAEFRNTTSETWHEAKVVLSNSQTSFQGLGEAIPQIQPWHIRLTKGYGENATDDGLFSRGEQDDTYRSKGLFGPKPRAAHELFGKSTKNTKPFAMPLGASVQPAGGLFSASNNAANAASGGGVFGSSTYDQHRSNAFGSSTKSQSHSLFGATPQASTAASGFGALQAQPNVIVPPRQQGSAVLANEDDIDLDKETLIPDLAALAFEESTWEETGLTATYTLPGTKTVAPSNTTRRHKITSIPLEAIELSHIIIPKLRRAAFLKARLRNTSSTALLGGPVGLTLDGTFLGNTTLPRSSPGEAFVLNLGVDPALNVVYTKPVVRRSESGVFQKEGSRIYTRSCTLTNTKNNTTIEAIVLDQIPVSEDDKLKVEVLTPKGLRKEGDQVVKAGTGLINEGTGKKGSTYSEKSAGIDKSKWGKATAKMKKEGEIEWDVRLNPGQGVKLELEYEARFPSGEGIVGV